MEIELRTVLTLAHLGALVLGFGGAIAADLLVVRNTLFRPIDQLTVETVTFIGKLVTVGLAMLWATGAGVTVLMSIENNHLLTNPKFGVKVAIVVVLTLNAFAVHKVVMPHLAHQIGRCMFDGVGPFKRIALALIGAVSVTSWSFPMLLGIAKELNGVMSFSEGMTIYINVLTTVAVGAVLMVSAISVLNQSQQRRADPVQPAAEDAQVESLMVPAPLPAQSTASAFPTRMAADLSQVIEASATSRTTHALPDYPTPAAFGQRSSIIRGDLLRDLPKLNNAPDWASETTWQRSGPPMPSSDLLAPHAALPRSEGFVPKLDRGGRRLFSLSEPPRKPERRLSS